MRGMFTFKFKINVIFLQSLFLSSLCLKTANISDFQGFAMWSTVRNKKLESKGGSQMSVRPSAKPILTQKFPSLSF